MLSSFFLFFAFPVISHAQSRAGFCYFKKLSKIWKKKKVKKPHVT